MAVTVNVKSMDDVLRRLQNETIEKCAQAAENYNHRDSWSDDPDLNALGYVAAGETCDEIAKAIRALAIT